jgi:uncharacterized protein YaiI (UPF0178 family)
MLDIYVDADACPVKEEVYRVARRYGLKVILVANSWMRTPDAGWLRLVVIESKELNAVDDWMAENVGEGDIAITGDIPLASRCLENGARAIGLTGRPFTPDNIGEALASRQLLSQLRDQGLMMGGPAPFAKRDRSRFLQALDETIQSLKRGRQ